jgi:DNA repair ATPase RecN
MDGLSGVASGMAVASLTLQLLQSVNTVKSFIRNVKGASKELERLGELLNRLGSLLNDVRNIIERQTSLQQCSPPLQTIVGCLKSCESSLDSLHAMAQKYSKQPYGNNKAFQKLKADIIFALKTKDMIGLEDRMQRDISNLQAALEANAASIQYGITRPYG